MKLLVIAYPRLSPDDFHRIEKCREKSDPLYRAVKPHFTFIFPIDNLTREEFSGHVESKLKGIEAISFSLDRASVHDGLMEVSSYVFLVPGTGLSEMTRLYHMFNDGFTGSGDLIPVPILPHITIGRSENKTTCVRMAEDWNSDTGIIHGLLDSLDIISYENEKVTTLKKYNCRDPASDYFKR